MDLSLSLELAPSRSCSLALSLPLSLFVSSQTIGKHDVHVSLFFVSLALARSFLLARSLSLSRTLALGFVFWVLVCYAATRLAIQLHQERIQVVRSYTEAWKHPAESNGTPTMNHRFEDICKRRYTNKEG